MNDLFHVITGTRSLEPEKYYSLNGEYAALLYQDGAIEVFREGDSSHVYILNTKCINFPNAFEIIGDHLVAAEYDGGIMFQNLTDKTINILNTDTVYSALKFKGSLLMAIREDKKCIDVFDAERAEKLFSMQSAAPIQYFAFSKNGEEAVAVTENGKYIVANLWQDESDLLEQANHFVFGY